MAEHLLVLTDEEWQAFRVLFPWKDVTEDTQEPYRGLIEKVTAADDNTDMDLEDLIFECFGYDKIFHAASNVGSVRGTELYDLLIEEQKFTEDEATLFMNLLHDITVGGNKR